MNVNETDEQGWTPLMHAAWNGDLPTLQELITAGADLEAADDDQRTALHLAAEAGRPELVQSLIHAGADTHVGPEGTPDPDGWLAYAVEQQERERGRELRAADTAACELASAAALGQTDTVRQLLAQGISANATDEDGEPALVKAAFVGHAEIVRLLLSAGADPDASGDDWNALAHAAAQGHAEICTLLAAHGADLARVFDDQHTVLDMAVRSKSVDTVRALLDAGADPRGLSRQEWANKARRVKLENRRLFLAAMASLSAALEAQNETGEMPGQAPPAPAPRCRGSASRGQVWGEE